MKVERGLNGIFTFFFSFFFSLFFFSRTIYQSPMAYVPFSGERVTPVAPPSPICCHTGREFKKLLQHSTHVTDVLYTTWRRQQHTHTHTQPTFFFWSFPGTTLDALLFFDFLFFRSLFAQLWKSQLDVRPKNSQVYPHWYTRTLNWWWPHTPAVMYTIVIYTYALDIFKSLSYFSSFLPGFLSYIFMAAVYKTDRGSVQCESWGYNVDSKV
jgi:hypothetical protein